MVLAELLGALHKGDIKSSIGLMRDWLATSQLGEPEALLQKCPPEYRPRVVLLMRDLLSRYPTTLLGAPVLMYCTPESEPAPDTFCLPYPTLASAQPCADLHFLGWLPMEAQLPLQVPFRPERHETHVPMNQIATSVAIFRSHPGVFDLDDLELPHQWWGELFRSVEANIQLSARILLPYPDALEAARVLQASATCEPAPPHTGFLSDNGWAWATDSGALFRETCRHLYSPD